jgi:ADP-ribosyl-[dinitrogen reductase] hydrolase
MLIELAIGDAYGAGFEYADPKPPDRRNNLAGYVHHPRHRLRPGSYTDDTQMSLAIAEMIVSGVPWTPTNLAGKFLEAFKRDPREGYASAFHAFLTQVADADEFLRRIQPKSDKSGAAMRAAPIGVFPTIAEVLEKAAVQAAITHDTPDGIRAAQAAALLSHYFLHDLGPKRDAGRFIQHHVPGQWNTPWQGKVGPKGWMSVRAAITAVVNSASMSQLLEACIDYTGDVDTVASIALAAASHCSTVEQDLPEVLRTGLEDGRYGRQYIEALDAQLLQRFRIHSPTPKG